MGYGNCNIIANNYKTENIYMSEKNCIGPNAVPVFANYTTVS